MPSRSSALPRRSPTACLEGQLQKLTERRRTDASAASCSDPDVHGSGLLADQPQVEARQGSMRDPDRLCRARPCDLRRVPRRADHAGRSVRTRPASDDGRLPRGLLRRARLHVGDDPAVLPRLLCPPSPPQPLLLLPASDPRRNDGRLPRLRPLHGLCLL